MFAAITANSVQKRMGSLITSLWLPVVSRKRRYVRGMVNFELSPLVPLKTVGEPEALGRLALMGDALWAATDGTGIFKYPESAAWVGPGENTSPRNQNLRATRKRPVARPLLRGPPTPWLWRNCPTGAAAVALLVVGPDGQTSRLHQPRLAAAWSRSPARRADVLAVREVGLEEHDEPRFGLAPSGRRWIDARAWDLEAVIQLARALRLRPASSRAWASARASSVVRSET